MPESSKDSPSGVEAVYRRARAGMAPGPAIATPTPAVGALLWRRRPGGDIEVFLGQRAATMRFAPGYWSFPGGAIEAADHDVEIAGASGEEAARLAALVREVHEETGLLLPREAGRFVAAARLITPDFLPIRFDARFYLVEVAAGARVDHQLSGGEFQDGGWMSPDEALERWRGGGMLLVSANRCLLEALRDSGGSMAAAAERCRAAAARENASVRAYQVTPGVFISPVRTPTLPPATTTNCYLLGDRELVVVDPASPYADEQAALDRALDELADRGHRVVEIWLTHHHLDHMEGAAHLRERLGVPVAAHAATAERVADRVEVDRLLDDGDTRVLAGDPERRLRVVFTPGHAPGHICVLEEVSGALVAGDMVAGVGTIVVEPSEGDMAEYLASLERMKTLAPRLLLPAHGPLIADPSAKIDEYIRHRLWREAEILTAVQTLGPAPVAEIVALAYRDTPVAIHWLAERSLLAHLAKLEKDGRVSEDRSLWRATP